MDFYYYDSGSRNFPSIRPWNGIRSRSRNSDASATASITAIYPDMAAELSALASTSETLSGLTGIYVAIFIGIPLCQKLYTWLEPKFAKLRHEPREVLTRKAEEKVEEA